MSYALSALNYRRCNMENKPWLRHYDYNVPTTIRYPRLNAHDLLGLPANTFRTNRPPTFTEPKSPFMSCGNRCCAWPMPWALWGLKKETGWACICRPVRSISLPIMPHCLVGAIGVNLNPMYTAEELKQLTANTGVTTLFTFDRVLPNIRPVCREVDIPRVIVTRVTDYIEGFGTSTPAELELEEGWHHFSQLLKSSTNTRLPRVQVVPEDPALIQFTGGTTGLPKGAVLTHANLVAATMQCALWGNPTIGLTPPEKRSVLAVLPFFHVYGTIVVMSWAMFNCATQIMVPRFELDELMGILGNFKEISFFPSVPTMINAILNHPKAGELQLDKKLGLLNSGAAPMPVELIERARDMGIAFSEGWGMSETTSLGIANPVFGAEKGRFDRDPVSGHGRQGWLTWRRAKRKLRRANPVKSYSRAR